MKIRAATIKDAKSIHRIYAPYVEKTAITFEYEVSGIDDFQQRIRSAIGLSIFIIAL